MEANVYRIMRTIISDTVSSYTIPDLLILNYLDAAIDKLSSLVDRIFEETITISAGDISAGYKDLTHEIIELLSPRLYQGSNWQLDGGARIRFVNSSLETAGTTSTLRFRGKYKKFNGVVLQQTQMETPTESDMGIVLWALGLYVQNKSVVSAAGDLGIIKQKTEENMTVSFAVDGSMTELSTPQGYFETAIKMFRRLPNAQDMFFGVLPG